ncbi:hypothetical protein [Caballeronia sp. DA-9]|uniref:hypothetical protein n=1 Tax=Caballeronia sp. DA-9 TaxID=3436237 RepID=UPI003F679326
MNNVLIGVGGSGQHVVHAYLRMLALIQCNARDVPHVYIIDADATLGGATDGRLNLCYEIDRLHRQLVSALSPKHRAHFALVRPYFQSDSESQPGRVETALELSKCPAYLTDIFLTDDPHPSGRHAEANDRTVDLLQGMMANAKIGATAFAYKIQRTRNDDRLKSINFGYADEGSGMRSSLLDDVRGARVAIVGSSFGGTGSGVIPALVRHLASLSSAGPAATRAFMTLPWFDIDAGGASAAAIRPNGIDPKTRNAATGLRTYLGELDNGIANANYVISQCLGDNATRADRGNTHQGEDPHVFNLVLASSIEQFLWDKSDSGAVAGSQANRKLFGLVVSQPEEKRGRFDAQKSAHLRFRIDADKYLQLVDIVKEAEVLALALEKGAEFIAPGDRRFSVGGDKHDEPEALRELCKTIATTYDQKPLKKAWLGLGKETAPDEIYQRLADALKEYAETLRRSLVWLDAHRAADDGQQQGFTGLALDHLFDSELGEGGRYKSSRAIGEQTLASRWDAYGLKVISVATGNTELGRTTPRVAQAFALFMNGLSGQQSFVGELAELVANQPGSPIYHVVAAMLARQVAKAVEKARNQRMVLTAAQDSAPRGEATAFIKRLNTEATPESARLCVIDKLKLDAPIGDVDQQDYDSPIQETHPLSLRQIDPYLGVSPFGDKDVAAVRKMADERGAFPEAALQGIPNILAPKLLQQWRLKRADFVVPGSRPLLDESGRPVLRSSEQGLYLHACRIIEAAFWLLFTDDARIALKEYQDTEHSPRSPLVELINSEIKRLEPRGPENRLPRKVIVSQPGAQGAGRVVFVNDPQCAWYLAANHEARRFFAHVYAELPTVRYGNSELDLAWRHNTSRATVRPERGSYQERMIVGFHDYLARISANHQNRNLPWARALKDICAALKAIVADVSLDPPTTARVADIDVMTDAATGQLGSLEIRRPVALSALQGIFVKDPIYFFVGDDTRGEAQWAGLWPVTGAAWEHLVPPEGGREMDNPMTVQHMRDTALDPVERSSWNVQSIRLKFKELGLYEISRPFDKGGTGRPTIIPGTNETLDNLDWAAAVWPNFEAPDWTTYVAGGFWQGARKLEDFDLYAHDFELKDWCLIFYGDVRDRSGATKFGEIGRIEKRMPVKLRGVPRAVELVINQRILGSMPIRLGQLPPNTQSAACELALDFGTSNTCMAIKLGDEPRPMHLALLAGEAMPLRNARHEPLPELTAFIGPRKPPGLQASIADMQFRTPKSPLFVFQSFDIPDKKHTPRSVPSELISLKPRDDPEIAVWLAQRTTKFEAELAVDSTLTKHPAELREAVVTPHYTPFPPHPGGMKEARDLAQFLGSGFHQDFKWPPPSGEEDNIAFRAVYIEQILLAAAATLRCAGIRMIKRLVATYPGAFRTEYRDRYIADVNKIVDHVLAATGIEFDRTSNLRVQPRSETVAALAATNPGEETMKVTIDMGGGTTDVGIIVPKPQSAQQPLFSYMSSIRYAGNDLLRAVAKSPSFLTSLDTSPASADDAAARLKIVIRNSMQRFNDAAARVVARAFFEGLFEYIVTVIAAVVNQPDFPAGKRIDIYLFGNGFRLSNVFLEQNAFDIFGAVVQQCVRHGLISQAVADTIHPIESDNDPKLDLVSGALKLSSEANRIDLSRAAEMLQRVDNAGHNRVPIWYPCVHKGSQTSEHPVLGTLEEREKMLSDPGFVDAIRIDEMDTEKLKASFPITSQYWRNGQQIAAIFHNAPGGALMALGQYYLEGVRHTESSFAAVVLNKLAGEPQQRPYDSPY